MRCPQCGIDLRKNIVSCYNRRWLESDPRHDFVVRTEDGIEHTHPLPADLQPVIILKEGNCSFHPDGWHRTLIRSLNVRETRVAHTCVCWRPGMTEGFLSVHHESADRRWKWKDRG